MRKNRMMRLASLLLVLTLLSTCVISGTFAKYTTADSGTDTARVAKWGFEATDASIDLDNLFLNAYDLDADGKLVADPTVVGASGADVVAPGTGNSVDFTFAYNTATNGISAPEVDYTFTVTATAGTHSSYALLDANPNFKWTLSGTGMTTAGEYQTVAELVAALNALDGTEGETGTTYQAGNLPAAFYGTTPDGAAKYTIGWVWDYETTDDTTTDTLNEMTKQDIKDTTMGNAGSLDSVVITIEVTATQVD